MRLLLLTITIVVVALVALPAAGQADSSIYSAIDASNPDESSIIMEYLWVYGIEERVEIRGDGLLRIERHVHNRRLFDGLHAQLAEKGDLSPYGWEIFSMEEGNYDRYWVADVGPESFDALIEILTDAGFPDIDDTYGDWEVWAIILRTGDAETRVGRVIRDNHEGFDSALIAIEEMAGIAKDTEEVDRDDFLDWFTEPKADMGGAS